MCVAHPRKWIPFLLASTVLADLDGQNLRFCEREATVVCVCSYNMQCVAGQPPDLSGLVAIYWCLSKQTLFIKKYN